MADQQLFTATDLTELQTVVESIKKQAAAIHSQIKSLKSARLAEYPTSEGVSLLELKHDLLLEYITCLVFFIYLKLSAVQIEGHPVIDRLITIRVHLEKIRPIEQKLRPQIDRFLAAAAASDAAVAAKSGARVNGARGDDDLSMDVDDVDDDAKAAKAAAEAAAVAANPLLFKPNLGNFIDSDDDDGDGNDEDTMLPAKSTSKKTVSKSKAKSDMSDMSDSDADAGDGGAAAPAESDIDDDMESDQEDPTIARARARATEKLTRSSSAVYRPPKTMAVRFDGDDSSAASNRERHRERETRRLQSKAAQSELIQDLMNVYDNRPETQSTHGHTGMGLTGVVARKQKEISRYEEDNFTRLQLSKKDKAELKRELKRGKRLDDEIIKLNDFGAMTGIAMAERADKNSRNVLSRRNERLDAIAERKETGAKKRMRDTVADVHSALSSGEGGSGGRGRFEKQMKFIRKRQKN